MLLETAQFPATEQNPIQSTELAHQTVASLALELPEVAERQDEISDQLAGLAGRHDLSSVLQDSSKAFILVGLAAKLATAQEQGADSYMKQRNFSDTAVGLLVGEINPYDNEIYDTTIFDVCMEYENKQLTRELDEEIARGLLDEVKRRMGVTAENEIPYHVHVLDAITSPVLTNGITGRFSGYILNSAPRNSELIKEDELQNSLIRDYINGLLAQGEELQKRLHGVISDAEAFVIYPEGVPHLFVMNPTAEKLLHPEVTDNAPYYDDEARRLDRQLLEHEYVHTQEPVAIDNEIAFGAGLEELRAEHFSGSTSGVYVEIENFFKDLLVVSGVDMIDTFDARPKGGTTEDIVTDLAHKIGVEAMVDVFMVAPEVCCNRGAMRVVHEGIGGYDGVIEAILIKEIEQGEGSAIEARIDVMARQLLGHDESLVDERRSYGSKIVIDLARDRMRYLRRAEYTQSKSVSQ